jgi:hypothetical protein
MDEGPKAPKPLMVAEYYKKLAMVFWKSNNQLLHATALHKLFMITKEHNKKFSGDAAQKMAAQVLLATLAVPVLHPDLDLLRVQVKLIGVLRCRHLSHLSLSSLHTITAFRCRRLLCLSSLPTPVTAHPVTTSATFGGGGAVVLVTVVVTLLRAPAATAFTSIHLYRRVCIPELLLSARACACVHSSQLTRSHHLRICSLQSSGAPDDVRCDGERQGSHRQRPQDVHVCWNQRDSHTRGAHAVPRHDEHHAVRDPLFISSVGLLSSILFLKPL